MSDVKIVFFDEVDDLCKVSLLFQLSLSWPVTPKALEEIRANDDRYTPEFGTFAVTEEGIVAAGHLIMRIPTATLDGKLDVGAVNAVATRPDFGRRGIMTSIMTRTHDYFRSRHLDYSVLTTSKRLGAALMYERLGYVEVDHSEMAVKYPNQQRTSAPSVVEVNPVSEADFAHIEDVYQKVVAGSYGFIYRPRNFLKARNIISTGTKPEEKLRIARRGSLITGYAYWESDSTHSRSLELLAVDKSSFHALLSDEERRNPDAGIIVCCDGLTDLEIEWLTAAGYQGPMEGYGGFFVTSLNEKADRNRIAAMYGVDIGKFRMGRWDST
jgi:GNAT superfamily N-acetyltransferase